MENLTALAINCTLKSGSEPSSTDRMIDLIVEELATHGVTTAPTIRAADLDIKPGVTVDEGDGDEWPSVNEQVMAADILILGTPIWMGNPSSVCRRVLERLDSLLGETDDEGRMVAFDKVAVCATVGNEDGAHAVGAQVFQSLNDVGFTIPAAGQAYWVGEAMGSVDFLDLATVPDKVTETVGPLARNAAHLARTLKAEGYPAN